MHYPFLHCELNDMGTAYDCSPTSDLWSVIFILVAIIIIACVLAPALWRWAGYWWNQRRES